MAAVAVEWTPARLGLLDDVTDFVDSITSRLMRRRVQIIPVANWGVTTALNACLHEAARLQTKWVAFQSLEVQASPEILTDLKASVGEDTLVAGVALNGHQFAEGDHTLTGTNCPWYRMGVFGQGCIRRGGTSEAAPEAVRQAVGGGCQSGLGAVTIGYECH